MEVLLSNGGILMVLVESYFDESLGIAKRRDPDGTVRDIPILCVAGYLMESEQSKLLSQEWRAVLDKYGLAYFHMVDCAHGNGVFAGLTKPQRIHVAAQMIGIIKKRTIAGFAIATNVQQFTEFMPQHPLIGTAYTFCVTLATAAIRQWVRATNYQGDVAYFFEAGHQSQPEADQIMGRLFNTPNLKIASRYVRHAFVEKARSAPVQAADLLAWQFYTDGRRQVEGHTVHRKDFESLIEHKHVVNFLTPSKMATVRKFLPWLADGTDESWPEELLPWKINAQGIYDGRKSS
ncbi:MAG TPA: hypothetical protein VHT03_12270 [Rhizomicrobium sp.]|nr:hypothetical protein [Rhizomicrobium sp.]